MSNHKILVFLSLAPACFAFSGCQADSARDQINSQNTADLKAKTADLSPAQGTFTGKLHLNSSDQDFDCVVTLFVLTDTEKSNQPQDPSETVEVVTLGGNISFPALVGLPLEDYAGFQSLLNPLDDLAVVTVDQGDFEPANANQLVLPYLAHDQKTHFGSFIGTLVGDVMSGTWEANDFGSIGTFALNRSQPTGASK